MQKLSYSKPTVTRMGSVAEKTEGGYTFVVIELLSKRGGSGGGGD